MIENAIKWCQFVEHLKWPITCILFVCLKQNHKKSEWIHYYLTLLVPSFSDSLKWKLLMCQRRKWEKSSSSKLKYRKWKVFMKVNCLNAVTIIVQCSYNSNFTLRNFVFEWMKSDLLTCRKQWRSEQWIIYPNIKSVWKQSNFHSYKIINWRNFVE